MATNGVSDQSIPRTVALCCVRQSMSRPGQPQRSPEQQRENIEAVCAQHGWQPLWFVEAPGHRSGFGEAQRSAWRRLKDWLHLPGRWTDRCGLSDFVEPRQRPMVLPDNPQMRWGHEKQPGRPIGGTVH